MDLLGGRTEDRLILGRVTVRGERLDPVSARLSVESALSGADIALPGLSPGAIVCIRALEDPLPRQVRADRPSPRPPRAWQSALSRKLEEVCRRAARPWLAPVPAGAVAVVFEGRAELFACLARDLVTGSIHEGWWYAEVLGGAVSRAAILSAMRAAPEQVPGATALLAARREAAAFAAQLSSREARDLTAALVDRYGLLGIARAAEIARAADRGAERGAGEGDRESGGGETSRGAAGAPPPGPRSVPVRWAPSAPETAPLRSAGKIAQEVFLGLSLTLAREPETARRLPFSEHAGSLWAAVTTSPLGAAGHDAEPEAAGAAPRADHDRPVASPPPLPKAPSGTGEEHRAAAAPPEPAAPAETARLSEAPAAAAPTTPEVESDAQPADPFDAWVKAALEDHPARAQQSSREAESEIRHAPPAAAAPATTEADLPAAPENARRVFGAPVDTRFGGLFFLINLGIALDLYGDFTSPVPAAIDLSIWDFVTLVGRELLGGAEDPGDPVFALLASLAGRAADEPPGEGFKSPDEWRLPPAWLRPSGEAKAPPHPPRTTSIREWLDWLLPHVRARLALAMPVDPGVDPGRLLCAVPAIVHASEAHLDVVMSLVDLPIEVRLSGLDRDPGWVPAAGRHVAFHFS